MDSISLIRTPIEAELRDFKELFDSSLSSSNALLDSVVSHIRQRNGKMMRPILVLLVARLYGAICPSTLHAAVSLELLHTASLVHDDVVDESSERRGQLSVNAIFNNKVAVQQLMVVCLQSSDRFSPLLALGLAVTTRYINHRFAVAQRLSSAYLWRIARIGQA